MHEVCALLYLALNQEAVAWSTTIPSSEWKDDVEGNREGASGRSPWADFMSQRARLKRINLLARIKEYEEGETVASLLQDELRYALCEEAEVFAIFDRVMTRGLRVVYCSEATDGLPSEEETTGEEGSHQSGGMGYLNLIQGPPSALLPPLNPLPADVLLKNLHPVLWEHLQLSMIQPQLYAISWARLLFGRVYVVTSDLLYLVWDYLFESTDRWKARASSGDQQATDFDDDNEDKEDKKDRRLKKLSGFDIRDPLLLKLACFILALVLEVRYPPPVACCPSSPTFPAL
jgi:hypothetical protein